MISTEMRKTTQESRITKSYVGQNGKAVIVCPCCKKAKAIDTDSFQKRKASLKVRCACSQNFTVYLDYRQSYRKPTKLIGTFRLGTGQERLVKINNLSLGGAQLEVVGLNKFLPGQNGYIDFVLDDRKQTHIRKNFSVKTVIGKKIGCQFKDDQAYNKELGFYLRAS